MSIEEIKTLVARDLSAVDKLIRRQLQPSLPLIEKISLYLFTGGGKRLRPLLVLLLARALQGCNKQHLLAATMIEIIHAATLLHDDVIDNARTRHHRKTAKEIWGSDASVLAGDFLYTRAFQIIVSIGSLEVTHILANATNTITTGEVRQFLNRGRSDADEATCLDIIRDKTAVLFAASAHTSALLAGADAQTVDRMKEFGMNFGIGFQLIDDVLDYAEASQAGKDAGNDLIEGKPTLPLVYALRNCSKTQRTTLANALSEPRRNTAETVAALDIVRKSGGLAYTCAKAREYVDQARSALADIRESACKQALDDLMTFLLARAY